jgi:hypothetical protein
VGTQVREEFREARTLSHNRRVKDFADSRIIAAIVVVWLLEEFVGVRLRFSMQRMTYWHRLLLLQDLAYGKLT